MKILPFLTIFGTIIGLPLQFINPSLQEAANIFFKLSAATYFGFVTLFTAIPHLDLLFLKIGIQEEFVSKIANIMIDLVFILQDAFLRIIFLLHGRKLYTTFQRLCHNSAKNLTSSAFKYYYWIVFVIWVFRVVLIVKGNWSRHTTKTFHDLNMTLEFETIQIGSMLFTNNFTVLVLFHFLADIFRLSLVTTAFLFYIATNEIHFNCVNELCYKITQDLEKESRLKLTFVFKSQAPTSVLQNYYPTVKKIDNLIFNEVVRGQICVLIPVYFLSCINLFYKGFTGFLDVFHAYWFEAILDGIGDVVAIFVIVYCGHDLSTQVEIAAYFLLKL